MIIKASSCLFRAAMLCTRQCTDEKHDMNESVSVAKLCKGNIHVAIGACRGAIIESKASSSVQSQISYGAPRTGVNSHSCGICRLLDLQEGKKKSHPCLRTTRAFSLVVMVCEGIQCICHSYHYYSPLSAGLSVVHPLRHGD